MALPLAAQSGTSASSSKITLTTQDLSSWSIRLKANESDQAHVWIDWNNDGSRQDDEAEDFSLYHASHEVVSKTITIYGEVHTLEANYQKLVGIDITQNPHLKDLKVSQNLLSELNLTGNPKLELLYCYNNKIEQLDVAKNTLLRKISCYTNHI